MRHDVLLNGATIAALIAFLWGSGDSDNDGHSNIQEYLVSLGSISGMCSFVAVSAGILGLGALLSQALFLLVGAFLYMTNAIKESRRTRLLRQAWHEFAPQGNEAIQHFVDQEVSGNGDIPGIQLPCISGAASHDDSSTQAQPTLSRSQSYASKVAQQDCDAELPPARRRKTRQLSYVTRALLKDISLVDTLKDELKEWDYDVFDLDAKVSNPLVVVGMTCLESISSIAVDHTKMRSFLTCIEGAYKTVPYHNHLHGATVARSAFSMCKNLGLGAKLNDKIQFALVLSGLIHDVGHPGLTAPFLNKIGDEVSLTYCDDSPLERMHLAIAFTTMRKEENAFLTNLDDVLFLRRPIVQAVLGTDMALHQQQCVRLTTLITNLRGGTTYEWYWPPAKNVKDEERIEWEFQEQAAFVMALFLHAADIASPTMPYDQFRRWNGLVQQEFHAQGDREKEVFGGLISTKEGYDRNETDLTVTKFTKGFIDFLVFPLFNKLDELSKIEAVGNISSNVKLEICLTNMENNKKELEEVIKRLGSV